MDETRTSRHSIAAAASPAGHRPPAGPGPAAKGAARPADGASGGWLAPALVYGGAALLGAALYQSRQTRQAERAHPPIGRFIRADGARLHYVDIGEGPPVVLIHGITSTLEDWFVSGLARELATRHRVIALDRPGYGYSDRPGGVAWSPERQARSIAAAMHRLGAQDAVVVAHSFGVLPAIALALQHEGYAKALVLLAGCYYPGASVGEVAHLAPPLPVIGPLARLTLAPSLARAGTPGLVAAMFEPQPPTPAFVNGAPLALATRPSQIAAAAEDTGMIERASRRFAPHYPRIPCRTAVITGSGDGIFDPDAQSRRFAEESRSARLVVVPATGHMVHHSAPGRVVSAIRDIARGRFVGDDKGPPPDSTAHTLGDPPAPVPAPPRPRKAASGGTARERRKTS